MELAGLLNLIGWSQLASTLPSLIGWTAAFVVAVVLKRRGAGKPVRPLIVGSVLMLAGALLRLPLTVLHQWLGQAGWSASDTTSLVLKVQVGVELVQLVGILCLVRAFWLQFHVDKTPRMESQSTF